MPTREYTREELVEAKQAGEILKQECGHSSLSGECLLHNETCCFEDQETCQRYFPKYKAEKEKS